MMEKKKIRIGLLPRIILAIFLGVAMGHVLPAWAVRVFVTFNGIFSEFLTFIIPLIIVFLCDTLVAETAAASYWFFVGSLAATQVLWVYALGVPLYFFVYKMRKKGVSAFLDGKKQKPAEAVHTA